MNAKQRRTLDVFNKAVTFAGTNPPVLASAPPGFAEQVQILQTAIDTIDKVAPDRGSGRPAKAANQRALLRQDLRIGQLQPIRRVARVLARTVIGMPHLVNLPSRLSSTQSLLDAAKATGRDVAAYKDQFVAKGLPADFLDQLNASIRALENAGTANVTARIAAANARGQLSRSFQDGRDALTLMDSTVRHLCNADPVTGAATLTVWNTIVSPRGRTNRTATDIVSGTMADVASSGSGSIETGNTVTPTTSSVAPATSDTASATPSQTAVPSGAAPQGSGNSLAT